MTLLPDDQSTSLGQRLLQLRVYRNLSQAELSRGVVSRSMLSLIETNKITPTDEVIRLLAERLHVPYDLLRAGVKKRPINKPKEKPKPSPDWTLVHPTLPLTTYTFPLYRNISTPTLWKWNQNVVIAETQDEAVALLTKHVGLCPNHNYWEQWGSKGFVVTIGRKRGKLYQHRVEENVRMWKEYVFYAESIREIDEHLKGVFGGK